MFDETAALWPSSAICGGPLFPRPGGLITEITWKAGNLYLQNEPVPMHYFSYGFCQSGQRYVSLHAIMVCRTGMKLSPNSVSEYSTFGGISL